MRSGKPLSLLSAKFLTFLCQSDVEQSKIRKHEEVVKDSPLRDGLALLSCMSLSGFEMESNSESSPGAGNRIQTGERGICMSAALSYPVSALKSSAKSRAQILILEPDLAVLDYLRSTLGS